MRTTKVIVLALAAGLLAAPAAPAQDALEDLARNVAAVISPGPDGRLLVVEEAHGASNIRTLAVGDDYAGWRIVYIGPDAVQVRRGQETRIVRILGRTQSVAAEAPNLAPIGAFSSAAPAQRATAMAELRLGEATFETWSEGGAFLGPDVSLALTAAEVRQVMSSNNKSPDFAASPPVDLTAPPRLTPEIEAELKRSLGIR